MTAKRHWNPRYIAYAKQAGMSPKQMLQADRIHFPGGVMCGFIGWIAAQWCVWARTTNHLRATDSYAILTAVDHQAFDKWIAAL